MLTSYLAAIFTGPALVLAQIPLLQQNTQPDINQKLAMYSKPAIVRVVAGCSGTYSYKGSSYPYTSGVVGTGYFVDTNGYIVTNAHVVNWAGENAEACKERLFENLVEDITGKGDMKQVSQAEKDAIRQDSSLLLEPEGSKFRYRRDVILPTGEVFPFDIKERGFSEVDRKSGDVGKDVAVIKIEVTDAPVLQLGNSDEAKIQDPVVVLGYPGTADSFSLSGRSFLEASVLNGNVANTRKTLQDSSPVLQLTVPVSSGSSGSPVLNQKGEVIGMITFGGSGRDEETNFPYAVPTSTILDFTRKSGAANDEGTTGPLYREGLDLFWQGDFEGAKKKFEAVNGLFSQHSEAGELIKQSEQEIAKRWTGKSYAPLLAGIGVAAAGLLGAYFIVRRRSPALAGGFTGNEIDDDPSAVAPEQDRSASRSERFQPMTVLSTSHQPATVIATQPLLELRNAQGQECKFYLQEASYRLGRDRAWADLKIPDEGWEVFSKRHAMLRKEGQSYRIYDGDGAGNFSTNGISIGGAHITPEGHLLKDGDRLKIGQDPHNQVDIVYYANRSSSSRSEANSRDGNG